MIENYSKGNANLNFDLCASFASDIQIIVA